MRINSKNTNLKLNICKFMSKYNIKIVLENNYAN